MAKKRDELIQDENTGGGLLGALGAVALGVIGAVIAANNNAQAEQREMGQRNAQKAQRRAEIQAEIERLKIQRNHYENEILGKVLYSDEISEINRKISRLANELTAL